MGLSDEELLDFGSNRPATYETGDGERRLQGENADLYRNHLRLAKHLDRWVERTHTPVSLDGKYQEGFVHGLNEIAANLRQGDYLPGGKLYDEG